MHYSGAECLRELTSCILKKITLKHFTKEKYNLKLCSSPIKTRFYKIQAEVPYIILILKIARYFLSLIRDFHHSMTKIPIVWTKQPRNTWSQLSSKFNSFDEQLPKAMFKVSGENRSLALNSKTYSVGNTLHRRRNSKQKSKILSTSLKLIFLYLVLQNLCVWIYAKLK